jgi:hypothetical protein
VGGNVVEDGRHGDVDNVGLAEGGGDGELVFLKKSNNKICFKEHYVLLNGINVINIISLGSFSMPCYLKLATFSGKVSWDNV